MVPQPQDVGGCLARVASPRGRKGRFIFPPSVLVMGAAGAGAGALAGHFAGGIPRHAIKDLADTLAAGMAGIVLVGEFTPAAGVEKLLKHAAKITKAQIDESADELKKAVDDAVKG